MKTAFILLGAVVLLGIAAPRILQDDNSDKKNPPKYEGSESCKKCHFKEHKTWETTKMANAFELLSSGVAVEAKKKYKLDPEKDYTSDTSCLPCHTTGYGKPGGYPLVEEGKAWTEEQKKLAKLRQGVGCESCHSPGERYSPYKKENKEYKWADIAKRGAVHPTEMTCTECHNKKGPTYREFKFKEKVGKDSHEIKALKYDHKCDHVHRGSK